MRRLTLIVATLSLVAAAMPAQAASGGAELHPVVIRLVDNHPDPAGVARGIVSQHGGSSGFVYEHAIRGFSADLPMAAIDALESNPQVLAISPDEVVVSVAATDLEIPTGYDRIESDQVGRTSSTTDVDIAILDTGVRLYHPDLNVYKASDCTSSLFGNCLGGGNLEDDHGHGSHVAGTAAAMQNGVGTAGVASGARIWSLKVLDSSGNGLLSWILAGVDAVTEFAGDIEVANMSLAGQFSDQTFDAAIANSVDAGVFYAVAAGNSGTDAATFSPANHPDVMTVSAVADGDGAGGGLGAFACRGGEVDDTLATFSNYGSVVDIAAPGVCIYSTWNDNGYRMASGTSMASPHVAGAAALYIAETGRDQDGNGIVDGNDVAAVRQALLTNAIPQGDACGFGGDTDGYAEPMLSLNTGLLGTGGCVLATPDSTGPSAPQVTTSADGFNIDIDWTGSVDPESGVLSYVLARDGSQVAELDAHSTTYRDRGLSPATEYSYTVTPKNRQGVSGSASGGSATTSSDDPSQVGHFAFDDGSGSTSADSSGWRRHGTLVNGPVWSSGIDGGALQFDGSDDRVDLDAAILDGADDVTAAFWIRTANTGGQAVVSAANSGNSNEYLIYFVNDTRLRLYVGTAETEGVQWDFPSIADGEWHHVTVVRNSGPEHAYLYLDGAYHGGWAVTKAMDPLQVSAALLGQDQDTVGGGFDANQALTGDLDELQLFDRVLSDSEIAALAQVTPNSAPVANADASATDEDNSVVIDVLANDTDDDGDVLNVESVTQPVNGTTVVNPDGTVSYTPNPDFNGVDSFDYTVSDGKDGSDTATVSVTVNAVNDAPVAADDSVSTSEDSPVNFGVLANDIDVDGDALLVDSVTQPVSGTSSIEPDGSIIYTPNSDFNGSDSFAYTVSDGNGASDTGTVNVTVTAVNDPPVATDDTASTQVDTPVAIDVLANDADVDGDALSITSVGTASNGTVVENADSTLTYTPKTGYSGSDSFTYTISDGSGGSDTATVSITVEAVSSIVQVAQSEMTVVGSRSGDLSATYSADGVYEELTEVHQGGPPKNRISELEHRWTFDIQSGDSIKLSAVAHRSESLEDDFVFEYSVDGGASFEPIFIVDSTTPTAYEVTLDPATSGQVIVRVTDDDRTVGNGNPDTVLVDLLAVETVNPQSSTGDIYEFRALSEATAHGSITSGDYTSTHQAEGPYEEISEEQYAGGKKTRLEHTWTFNASEPAVTFNITASTTGSEGFTLAYSTDGSTWNDMALTLGGSAESYSLPSSVTGTIHVRVTDNDGSRGDSSVDAIQVALMYFSTAS